MTNKQIASAFTSFAQIYFGDIIADNIPAYRSCWRVMKKRHNTFRLSAFCISRGKRNYWK